MLNFNNKIYQHFYNKLLEYINEEKLDKLINNFDKDELFDMYINENNKLVLFGKDRDIFYVASLIDDKLSSIFFESAAIFVTKLAYGKEILKSKLDILV